MKSFLEYLYMEQDPMAGGMPPGGDPMGGGMGMDPMMGGGMPMGGGMGMDPMMGGGMPQQPDQGGEQAIKAKPMGVWEAIESILKKQDNTQQKQQQPKTEEPKPEQKQPVHLRGTS